MINTGRTNWVSIEVQHLLMSSYIFTGFSPLDLLFGGNKGNTASAEVPKKIAQILNCDKSHELDSIL